MCSMLRAKMCDMYIAMCSQTELAMHHTIFMSEHCIKTYKVKLVSWFSNIIVYGSTSIH